MKIGAFIKALLPKLEKDTLAEDLRITLDELDKIVIPAYNSALPFFKTYSPVSKEVALLSSSFKRNYSNPKMAKQPNFISDICIALPNVRANAETILGQAEQILSEDIISEGLTAKKVLLVRAASMLSFISRYSIDLLNLVYEAEAQATGTPESYESIKLAPKVRERTLKHIVQFGLLLSDYGMEGKKFADSLSAVPDILINSKNASSVASVYKEKEVDPFSDSYMPGFTASPIYHVRLVIAEWQNSRYQANKEKKQVLELRLLYLKQLKDKGSNAALEREIEYTQNRVTKLERYLESVENDLGV